MLVDRGYNKHRGFYCLQGLQKDFRNNFEESDIDGARERGLNDRFRISLKKAIVRKNIFLTFFKGKFYWRK